MTDKLYLYLFILFCFWQAVLFSEGIKELVLGEPEEEIVIQDLYDEMEESLSAIGFFIPQLSANLEEEVKDRFLKNITEDIVFRGEYKPYSLEEWFSAVYKEKKPDGIIELRKAIIREKFPLDYISTINISRFTDKYYVQMALYSMEDLDDVVYSYRIIEDLDEDWDKVRGGLLDELFFRINNPKKKTFNCNMIYIEPFSVNYLFYYKLESGAFSFTEIPFISMDKVDFYSDGDLFSHWLGMRLHLSGFFPVIIHDLKSRVSSESPRREGCTWGIKGDVRISSVMSVLRLSIYDYRRRETVAQFDFPFNELSSQDIAKVIDDAIPHIMEHVLSTEAKSQLTVIKPDLEFKKGEYIYTEMGYQGPLNSISAFPACIGLNRYLLVKKDVLSPDLTTFNRAVLVNPEGDIYSTLTQEETIYAERLFE